MDILVTDCVLERKYHILSCYSVLIKKIYGQEMVGGIQTGKSWRSQTWLLA